jgi:hypothetical protein
MLVDWFWFSLVLSILLLWLLWHWPQLWPHLHTTSVAAAREGIVKLSSFGRVSTSGATLIYRG